MFLLLALLSIQPTSSSAALTEEPRGNGRFSFLDELEKHPDPWTQETSGEDAHLTGDAEDNLPELSIDLTPFYRDFAQDGIVNIYMGYGYEAYSPGKGAQLYKMLNLLGSKEDLELLFAPLERDQQTVRFRDVRRGIDYQIQIGPERDDYRRAFSKYEVVMYTGHSRYGRGPAFGTFWNYYRMGDRFETIEVDTRNPYFDFEPIVLTERFPLLKILLGGFPFPYQYRGQQTNTSYLPSTSYTKNIPGGNADLATTKFIPGRQILYFHSCKNRKYWRNAIRSVLTDPARKVVFGTSNDSFGGARPDSVLIISIVRQLARTEEIVSDLNATQDCNQCFTSY
ncbi:MAG: hypothetical protein A2X94_15350 [Bdellovibrionales bacterium GWB1_55_8]|nr:MAG: hypothetical protein A2X94_15350 [Bdellovibrionales bacterium GWB1_55_8]